MIKRFAAIAVLTYLAFAAEFILYNMFGAWGKPELVLLVIVFCGLYWGIRHSLAAAIIGGALKDAFGVQPFGTYLFVFIVAAFLTTLIRRNFYQPGSRFSRAAVAAFVLVGVFILELILRYRLYEVRLDEAIAYVFVPQLLVTMVAATFIFHRLRDMAVRWKL